MATQTTVINESKPGKWSIYWELRGIPARTDAETLKANKMFTCGKKLYDVQLVLFEDHLKKWVLALGIKTMIGNDK